MLFVFSKVFWIFVAPVNLALILSALGIVLLWTRWAQAGRWLVSVGVAAFLIIAALPIGGWLTGALEGRFPPQVVKEGEVYGIIVLGGSTSPGLTVARGQPSLNGAAERLVAFAELSRRYPDAKLVFTGGSGSLAPGRLREADVAAAVLRAMDIDTSRILFERESRNTFENGTYTKALVNPAPGEKWLLVTSAMYMPRAVGVFREAGWPVTPYPVDYRTGGRIRFNFGFDLARRGESMQRGLREWIGLVAYRMLGRTSAVFPAPEAV
jgi:uncharacterized SAM-binding protein YcdF (DUF218 family)